MFTCLLFNMQAALEHLVVQDFKVLPELLEQLEPWEQSVPLEQLVHRVRRVLLEKEELKAVQEQLVLRDSRDHRVLKGSSVLLDSKVKWV